MTLTNWTGWDRCDTFVILWVSIDTKQYQYTVDLCSLQSLFCHDHTILGCFLSTFFALHHCSKQRELEFRVFCFKIVVCCQNEYNALNHTPFKK